MEPKEASITVNGVRLTEAQSMTVRVALNSFALDLREGLGEDAHGKSMTEGYKARLQEVMGLVHQECT